MTDKSESLEDLQDAADEQEREGRLRAEAQSEVIKDYKKAESDALEDMVEEKDKKFLERVDKLVGEGDEQAEEDLARKSEIKKELEEDEDGDANERNRLERLVHGPRQVPADDGESAPTLKDK